MPSTPGLSSITRFRAIGQQTVALHKCIGVAPPATRIFPPGKKADIVRDRRSGLRRVADRSRSCRRSRTRASSEPSARSLATSAPATPVQRRYRSPRCRWRRRRRRPWRPSGRDDIRRASKPGSTGSPLGVSRATRAWSSSTPTTSNRPSCNPVMDLAGDRGARGCSEHRVPEIAERFVDAARPRRAPARGSARSLKMRLQSGLDTRHASVRGRLVRELPDACARKDPRVCE